MIEWIHLVNEKNTLLRCESELVIQSNSIQLEDRQARLEQQIRDLLTAERKNWLKNCLVFKLSESDFFR